MYSKVYSGPPTITGIRGTHHNPGSPYVYFVRQSVGPNGLLERIQLTPFSIISSANSPLTPNIPFDMNGGSVDVLWSGVTLKGQYGAQLYKFPTAPTGGLLSNIDPATLPFLTPYSAAAVPETGSPGNYYAVRFPTLNTYAVLHIYTSGGVVKAEWITYLLNNVPTPSSTWDVPDPWDVVVTLNEDAAYVSGGDHVFKIPNIGTSSVDFSTVGNSSYFNYIIDDGSTLSQPRQMALYNNQLYVVDETSLWRIDTTPGGAQTEVVSGLQQGMGLLINELTGKAIVSDETGALYQVNLGPSTAATLGAPIASLPGASGFLTWADDSRSALYAALPGPVNKVVRVDLSTLVVSTVLDSASGGPANPWSVEVFTYSRLVIASDQEIGALDLTPLSDALLLGIGLVPFDYINNTSMTPPPAAADLGKADTSRVPSYFYQVQNAAFGGNLTLMLNHKRAWETGLRYYRVTLIHPDSTSRVITNPFTDLRFNPVAGLFQDVTTSSTGSTGTPVANAFSVRDPTNDSRQPWYNPYLGAIINTTIADNGLCTLRVEFFDATGALVTGGTYNRLIRINNNPATTSLFWPRLGGPGVSPTPGVYPVPDCGCITYGSKNDRVEIDFTAWHPDGFASYSLAVYRGGQYLPALAQNGPADTVSTLHVKNKTSLSTTSFLKVGHIIGDCNVASIAIAVSVPVNIIDGYRPVSWLSASSVIYFTLVPQTVSLSTPWADPGN